MKMKIYSGKRDKHDHCVVHVIQADGDSHLLDPRFKDCSHSPTGFEWGYTGSGPAQLAFAILADAVHIELAHALHQRFKFAVIGQLARREPWRITEQQVLDFVMEQMREKQQ
jgi:hypothetical protein